jgi:hypothetical protein
MGRLAKKLRKEANASASAVSPSAPPLAPAMLLGGLARPANAGTTLKVSYMHC